VADEDIHLLGVSEGQERDETHESLAHVGRGLHKGTVYTIQKQLQLVTVTAQLGELLKQK
jgi:hypothetical protein